jgi:hypothetical protein
MSKVMQVPFLLILTDGVALGAEKIIDRLEVNALHVQRYLGFDFAREIALVAVEHVGVQETMLVGKVLLQVLLANAPN